MKRVIPVILIALLSGTPAVKGQLVESVGLKAGITIANQSYRLTPIEYTLETDPAAGPGIAVFLESFRHERLSFQADLSFLAKGSKTTTRSVTVNHLENDRIIVNEGDLSASKFYYLSLAPMARYRIGRERINPYFLMGPRLDFLLKYTSDSDYPLEEQNGIVLGLNGGAGVEFNFNELGVFVELQYQPDLTAVTSQDPLRIKNSILLITLGVSYLKGR